MLPKYVKFKEYSAGHYVNKKVRPAEYVRLVLGQSEPLAPGELEQTAAQAALAKDMLSRLIEVLVDHEEVSEDELSFIVDVDHAVSLEEEDA